MDRKHPREARDRNLSITTRPEQPPELAINKITVNVTTPIAIIADHGVNHNPEEGATSVANRTTKN
jgi:hypothetical protein